MAKSAIEIWPVYVILQKESFYQMILTKIWPENFQAVSCIWKIKQSLPWKMKFL